MKNWVFILALGSIFFASCDSNRLFDENKDLPTDGWYYKNKLVFDVNVTDTNSLYNLFVNLRVASDYPYANIFVNMHSESPTKLVADEEKQIQLADETGQWLGKGLGDLYDYQVPVKDGFKFHELGIYHFELQHNMRVDTLQHVLAAGIRLEKTQ
jgi:gliding motility-associated lipoprotein GldH